MKLYHLILILVSITAISCSWSKRRRPAPKPAPEVADPVPAAPSANNEKPAAKEMIDKMAETEKVQQAKPAKKADWSYSGVNGPSAWGDISSKYVLCKIGKKQSPIDLRWSRPKKGHNLSFFYKNTKAKVVKTENTLALLTEGGNRLVVGGQDYDLKSIHFHSPSEHSLSGRKTSMEIQFAHRNKYGQWATLSALIIEGDANPAFDQILALLSGKGPFGQNSVINPEQLIPSIHTHYAYMGSATVPPCTEGVSWNVLNTPITFSRDQILAFRSMIDQNARPIQSLNGRVITNH